MPFNEEYISDSFDDNGELGNVYTQISELGFDPINEIPKVFSHYHITEGYDTYHDIRQCLEIATDLNAQTAVISFIFRSSRDSDECDFKLNDIEARLYLTEKNEREKIAEMSFGKKDGFPTKNQMIKEISEKALELCRISEIKRQFGMGEHTQTNNNNKSIRHL
jgi:hypothetical protein